MNASTPRNLTAAEKRIADLEALLARVNGDADAKRATETAPPAQPHISAPTLSPAAIPAPPLHLPPVAAPSQVYNPASTTPALPTSSLPPAIPAPMHASPLSATSSSPHTVFSSAPSNPLVPANDLVAPPTALPSFNGSSPFSTGPSRPPFTSMQSAFSNASTIPSGTDILPAQPAEPVPEPESDGMGSLTVEQGGQYLGSLSGAALLNFLQRCAADVNLSVPGSGKSAASPTSTISNTAIPPEQLSRFVDAYFACFHVQYPILHEATFRAQMADIIPRPGGPAWALLYQVVLGIGSMCVVGDWGEGGETTALYERAITTVNPLLFEAANLTAVQAFVLLANFAQKLNHVSSGSVYLGIGLRLAINMGLHCESSTRNATPFEQEQRRRIWWVVYCFSAGSDLTFGHPSTLPTSGVDVLPLTNVHDVSFTPAAHSRPPPVDAPTPYASIILQTFFHSFATQVINYLTTAQATLTSADVLRLNRDVDTLQSSLPPYFFREQPAWFDFSRAKLCWRLDNLRMVILRQTFLKVSLGQGPPTPEEEQIFERCVACAGEVIRSVQRFTDSGPKSAMEWWYCLHFLFPAAFIPLIALRVRSASASAVDWVVVLQSAKGVLERVQHALLKPLAGRCLAIISAVANLDGARHEEVNLDVDFTSFLEKLAAPVENEGMPSTALQVPGLGALTDLDALFSWFTPAGSPQPQPM
ncbi:hypothetical protein Rhopal_007820-T1 [Rhodotorula paludigena]|uniref:Xylanolytic transcriptional activator regulatory domain-containing protein n=1 Tax=Rhodotorula paludigena TaxID=86838 RepID=A0AAV5GZT7_9BASI|nr:hypothetical protein Rhopal_007820-T1 [Rhodotorula paludigena]